MTLTVQTPTVQYDGDGITTVFPYVFTVDQGSELVVTLDDTEQIEFSDYTVENITELGGEVHFIVAPAFESILLIARRTQLEQQVDYEPFAAFPADTMEWSLDRIVRMIQELKGGVQDGSGSHPNLVQSVFGRVGHILALAGDYIAVKIGYSNDFSTLVATDVQEAINELDTKGEAHLADTDNPHEVLHDQLTDVTTDQHHDKVHADTHHVGGDDLLNHDDITGSGSNSHQEIDDHIAVAVTADDPFALTESVVVSDGTGRKVLITPVTIDSDGNIKEVETIDLNTDINPHPAWKEGRVFYDEHDKCLVVYNEESEVTQQIGREVFVRAYNDNDETILNGKPVSVVDVDVDGDPLIHITDASDKFSALAYIGIATHDIEVDTWGYVTIAGAVKGLNTDSLIANAPLWVDPENPGEYIQYQPSSPAWEVRVGGVSKSHISDGVIYSRPRVLNNTQSAFKFFNGAMLESAVLVVSSDGATATCEVKHPDLTSDVSLLFNEEFVTPAGPYIVTLTSGTDDVPVRNWIYFSESTGLLTVSLTGFPTTGQFVPVADIICQSAGTSQSDGFYKVHAWTDHLASDTGQGHLSHLNAWIRNRPAAWISGTVLTASEAEGVNAPTIDLSYTSGVVFQLHSHVFPAIDTADVNKYLYIQNHATTPYLPADGLNSTDLAEDANGDSLNNKVYSVVVWAVVSEDDDDCQLYLNLPNGFYTTNAGGIADANGTADYGTPVEYLGTAFLLTRLVIKNSGGNVQIISGGTFDLRGTFPAATGGGVAGGSGLTLFSQLLDTPASYAGAGEFTVKVNAGETGLEFVDDSLIYATKAELADGVSGTITIDSGYF